jgi:hypothetical protein
MFRFLYFIVLVLSLTNVYKSNAQTLSAKLERVLTTDLNSLFKSIQDENSKINSSTNMSLVIYSKNIMKSVKGFKLSSNNDSTHITYLKEIKNKGKIVSNYISFSTNRLNSSQFYISHSLYYLPNKDLESFYNKILELNFGDKVGALCSGTKIFTNNSLPGYISLNNNSVFSGMPYIIYFPNGFITENYWSSWGNRRLIPFEETIIIDSLPTFENYHKINDDIKSTNKFNFTSSSNDFSHYELSFFQLAKKEYDEYIINNLDRLQTNPNVNEFYRVIDSLQINKRKELNVRWFSVGVRKAEPLTNSNTKYLSFSIFLYSIPFDRNQEIKELSEKLTFCLNEANLNDIINLLNGIFDQIKSDTLATNVYEQTTGNFKITAEKIEPFQRSHWQFSISNKGCE